MSRLKIDIWKDLTADDLIKKMFERTDADGLLYMPSFFMQTGDEEESLRCGMSWKFYDECFAAIEEFNRLRDELEKRPFAFQAALHAMYYCKLSSLDVPDQILENEAKALASALTLFRFCERYEYVDHAVCRYYDRLELMNEEELDELSRPKSVNTRKSMAPLFVYLILQQHSSSKHPLKQQEILTYLAEAPYEVVIDRKTLGRILHNLSDSQFGIYTDRHRGSWYMGGRF